MTIWGRCLKTSFHGFYFSNTNGHIFSIFIFEVISYYFEVWGPLVGFVILPTLLFFIRKVLNDIKFLLVVI